MQQTTAATYREQPEEAKRLLDVAKETWRQCHDRDVDHTYALMSLVLEELGEPAVRDMYDRVLLPLFVWRYEKFDIDKHPWDEALETLMLVACEAMRGHLVGPERTGDFELIELEDRFILRFDACGSGGRTLRGDWIERTPARMEAPWTAPGPGQYRGYHFRQTAKGSQVFPFSHIFLYYPVVAQAVFVNEVLLIFRAVLFPGQSLSDRDQGQFHRFRSRPAQEPFQCRIIRVFLLLQPLYLIVSPRPLILTS